jgi:phosphoglycerate dehydrogenase-like enzyme
VGLGGIGTEVARLAHGLGMRVIATRNSSREGPDFVERVGLSDELLAFAAQADVVVTALPLTPQTTKLFDAAFFSAMKPGGYFINVGRGASVVTEDLVAALRDGRLAGAGLDVTDPEPLPPGHALWALPNVLVTPHVSTASDVQDARSVAVLHENLRRYVAGERMLNVVDIARGY